MDAPQKRMEKRNTELQHDSRVFELSLCNGSHSDMKRLNRKEIIQELEYLRQGFASGHQRAVENQDRLLAMHQRAMHGNANNYIAKLGGERVELPNLESRENTRKF